MIIGNQLEIGLICGRFEIHFLIAMAGIEFDRGIFRLCYPRSLQFPHTTLPCNLCSRPFPISASNRVIDGIKSILILCLSIGHQAHRDANRDWLTGDQFQTNSELEVWFELEMSTRFYWLRVDPCDDSEGDPPLCSLPANFPSQHALRGSVFSMLAIVVNAK